MKAFVYTDLVAALNGFPWKVKLVPSIFTITPDFQNDPRYVYQMGLSGISGNVTINWGDGTSEPYMLTNERLLVEHQYATAGNFKINVTGDLDKIETFYSFYDDGAVKDVNLQGLIALREISMGYHNTGPAEVDFTHNTKLENASMPFLHNLKQVMLPDASLIRFIDVSGPNQMQTVDIDALIEQVYQGVRANATSSGHFTLYSTLPPGPDMVGPPSAAALNKLQELRDNYSWMIDPNPE